MLLAYLLVTLIASANPVKIAVIDTGYTDSYNYGNVNLCPSGHRGFTKDKSIEDKNSHGSQVAKLISEQLKGVSRASWCLVIIKYYEESMGGLEAVEASERALQYLLTTDVKYINYSSSGSSSSEVERALVKALINRGVKVFVSAGNEGLELSWLSGHERYPAMYDKRIYVIGAVDARGNRSESSNYGEVVKHYELGVNVSVGGALVSGTSFSTAIFTGKTVRQDLDRSGNGSR